MSTLPSDHLIRPPFDLISPFLALPNLRGFWPMSSVDASSVYDLSGQGRTLTINGSAPTAIYNDFVNYFDLNGSTQYLTRANEAGLGITGALTCMLWYWPDTVPSGARGLLSKYDSSAAQKSYLLFDTNTGTHTAAFIISTDGTATVSSGSSALLSTGRWYHLAGLFVPSTKVAVFVNGVETANTTSIPATIFNSTASFAIGTNVNGIILDGRIAPGCLCADDLSVSLIRSNFAQTRGFFDV
jgi:hypothetical protein